MVECERRVASMHCDLQCNGLSFSFLAEERWRQQFLHMTPVSGCRNCVTTSDVNGDVHFWIPQHSVSDVSGILFLKPRLKSHLPGGVNLQSWFWGWFPLSLVLMYFEEEASLRLLTSSTWFTAKKATLDDVLVQAYLCVCVCVRVCVCQKFCFQYALAWHELVIGLQSLSCM